MTDIAACFLFRRLVGRSPTTQANALDCVSRTPTFDIDREPEKLLREVVERIVNNNRSYPKANIGVVLSHADRETDGLTEALDQFVVGGQIVEYNDRYWLSEHVSDDT